MKTNKGEKMKKKTTSKKGCPHCKKLQSDIANLREALFAFAFELANDDEEYASMLIDGILTEEACSMLCRFFNERHDHETKKV